MKKVIMSIVLALIAPLAMAGPYMGAEVVQVEIDDVKIQGVNVVGGYDFESTSNVLGVRTKYLVTSKDDNIQGIDISLDEMTSIDLTVTLPITDSFRPYFAIGKMKMEATANYGGYTAMVDETYNTFSAGIKYKFLESVTLTAEYSGVNDNEIISVGLLTYF